MKMRIHGIFQWHEPLQLLRWNWCNFDFIHIGCEAGSYTGWYFETTFILLGLGFTVKFWRKSMEEWAEGMKEKRKECIRILGDERAAQREILQEAHSRLKGIAAQHNPIGEDHWSCQEVARMIEEKSNAEEEGEGHG